MEDIQDLYSEVDGPWALIGDFNATLKDSKRIGPALANSRITEPRFQATLDICNLIDVGFSGDPFTWARGTTRKRLDRALCNLDWRLRFIEAGIAHLPKLKSDHAPLLMTLDHNRPINRRRRPFRFEAVWLSHPSFNQFVKDNWRLSLSNFHNQLKEF